MKSIRSALARRAAVAILAAFAAALPQIVVAQENPLAGTWNFVPERSTFAPGPARYKSMTLNFSASGQTVMSVEGVDAQGKPVKASYVVVEDGKEHPVTGMPAFDTVTLNSLGNTLATYIYAKRKAVAVMGNRMLSPDGNTLTFSEKTFDARGRQTSTSTMLFAKPGFELASVTPSPAAGAASGATQSALSADETAAAAALAKGDDDDAIRLFTKVIDAKQQTPTLYYNHVSRGVAYAKKGMNEQALADFDMALKLKPDDVDARFRRGGTRVNLRQFPAAIEDLTAVIQADAMNAGAYRLRAFSYIQLGDDKNAGPDYDKACSLNKELCI